MFDYIMYGASVAKLYTTRRTQDTGAGNTIFVFHWYTAEDGQRFIISKMTYWRYNIVRARQLCLQCLYIYYILLYIRVVSVAEAPDHGIPSLHKHKTHRRHDKSNGL
jgi:hypothetical protein